MIQEKLFILGSVITRCYERFMIHEAEESLDNLLSPNGPLAGVIKITDFPLANGKNFSNAIAVILKIEL